MKRNAIILALALLALTISSAWAQGDMVIRPSNRSVASMEKNMLFHAHRRFTVTQSGSISLPLAGLFDGNFSPLYSPPINPQDPYVITIAGLSHLNTQDGAWIGWTTRYYGATRFKIEVYNIYGGANQWVSVAEVDNYNEFSYIVKLPSLAAAAIRFTFYNTTGPGNELGLSELFFMHNEATQAYDNLMVKYDEFGNVGIGTGTPKEKLSVMGKIRAQEVKVEMEGWPDYVFEDRRELTSLLEIEKFIKENKRLPGVPSADSLQMNGLPLGEMVRIQQEKIEELTLHLIQKEKEVGALNASVFSVNSLLKELREKLEDVEKRCHQNHK